MESKKNEPRGIPLNQYRLWKYSIEKEDKLRLKWFKNNENRLEEIANHVKTHEVSDDVKNEEKELMFREIENRDNYHVEHQEVVPPIVEEAAVFNVMRPVDKEITNLMYSDIKSEGRRAYLKERVKVIPELRYYFPETSSFVYGWNMWDHNKTTKGSKFARQQVIRGSFYRRRGVTRDPEWYKEPARLSPQVCGRI